jgi:hypothetical protein
MGKMREPHKILVEKVTGNRQLGSPSPTWKQSIKVGTESGVKVGTRFVCLGTGASSKRRSFEKMEMNLRTQEKVENF